VQLTVIDSQPDRQRDAMVAFPGVSIATCLDDVQDKLDAVVIATPPDSHSAIAQQALAAELHTLVEKPMTTSVADAEALVKTAEACGLNLMVGHTFEHNAAIWELRRIIRSGELGRILYLETARLLSGPGPRDDCNVIWDLAPHDISIVSYLLDEFPETVSGRAQHNLSEVHADVAHLRLDFARAAIPAFVHVSWLAPKKVRRISVVGDQKMLVFDDLSVTQCIEICDVEVDFAGIGEGASHAMPVLKGTDDVTSAAVNSVEPLLVQDTHFIDCVRTGRRPEPSGERGLGVVKVLAATDEAITKSASVAIQQPLLDSPPATIAVAQVAS
jgi:predicted dehydrogenase